MKYSRAKTVLFSILPLVLLVLATESYLRLSGFYFGHVSSNTIGPFMRESLSESRFVATPADITLHGYHVAVPKEKPTGSLRVFLLGGSSVQMLWGDTRLKQMLEQKYPGRVIEVFNIGLGGAGSTRVLRFFREALQYQPDVMVVYSGHNEFPEAFIDTLTGRFSAINRVMVYLSDYLRSVQFLKFLIYKFGYYLNNQVIDQGRHEKTGAPFFIQNNFLMPERQHVTRLYERNLREMVRLAREHSVRLVMASVAFNRLSVFQNSRSFADASPLEADRLRAVLAAHASGGFDRLGRLLSDYYDSMTFPWHATDASNAVVERIAADAGVGKGKEKAPGAVSFVDVDARVRAAAAQNELPGADLFNDHCHLNSKGQQVMLRALAEAI